MYTHMDKLVNDILDSPLLSEETTYDGMKALLTAAIILYKANCVLYDAPGMDEPFIELAKLMLDRVNVTGSLKQES